MGQLKRNIIENKEELRKVNNKNKKTTRKYTETFNMANRDRYSVQQDPNEDDQEYIYRIKKIEKTTYDNRIKKIETTTYDALHVGLMFSTGDFLTGKLETPPNWKSLWMIALTTIRINEVYDHVNTLYHLNENVSVFSAGSLFYIKWNHKYIIQSENGTGILLRIVQHNPEPVDETVSVSYHRGNPTKTLTNHIDMKPLRSRLQFLSNISS